MQIKISIIRADIRSIGANFRPFLRRPEEQGTLEQVAAPARDRFPGRLHGPEL